MIFSKQFLSDDEQGFYSMLGLYVSLWATVEHALGRLIEFLYKYFEADMVEKERPLNLSRRIRFLKKAANRIPALTQERDEIQAMMEFLSSESEFRHNMIHGIDKNFRLREPFFKSVERPLDRKNPDGKTLSFTTDAADMDDRYHRLGEFSLCLVGLQHRLMEQLEKEIEAMEAELQERTAKNKKSN